MFLIVGEKIIIKSARAMELMKDLTERNYWTKYWFKKIKFAEMNFFLEINLERMTEKSLK